MSTLNIALIGNGRMGKMIESVCAKDEALSVAGFVGPGDCEMLEEIRDVDVAIDFSYPGNLDMMLENAMARKIPLVIGTTGLTAAQEAQIAEAAKIIPIVRALNFSTGVAVLRRLVAMAAKTLGEDFDIEIVETHHNQKEDAPSGTAKALLAAADPDGAYAVVNGREGRPGKRGREIGMHAVRGGTVAGEHSVFFYGPMEEIELRHRADSREIFARGAVRAAQFAAKAKPGLYTIDDVLFGG